MKERKTKLNITHIITGLNQGGAEAMLVKLVAALQSRCDTRVISLMDEGVHGAAIEQMGIPLHCLHMRPGALSLRALWRLRHLLKVSQPDVVQTWMYHGDLIGGLASRCAGVRKIFWNVRHSNLEKNINRLSTRVVARLNAILSNVVPLGIVVNSHRGLAAHRHIGYADRKMVVIPNAFDIALFNKNKAGGQSLHRELGIDYDLPVLGMAARFNPQKDHQTLLRALRLVADKTNGFRALLCGSGIDTANPALRACIRECGLESHVLLLGARSEMPQFMNALDCHVLSSACGEGFPNVLGEAMACGVPCVTTDVGDAAEIVGDTGWVVPPRNPPALAKAILDALAESPEARRARGCRCRQRVVENYEISHIADVYYDLWTQDVIPGVRP
jgi:glycosyltransferase involved in cell wall biosynthesis